MTQERVAYVNGQVVPENEAKISIGDTGFLYGDAVFDTTRSFGHRIFRLEEHLDRLYNSLKYMRIDPGMTKIELSELTTKIFEANLPLLAENEDYWITQRFTRGMRGDSGSNPTVIVECYPLPFEERARFYRDGLPIATPSIRRTPPQSMSPRAKMHNYINMIQAELEIKAQNPEAWAIMLDINGNLCEGQGSNIFLVKDGAIFTPKEQYVLAGISRSTVIDLAEEIGIDVHQTDIDLFDAYTADEAFVTSTSFCICQVSTINGTVVGNGASPGPITDRLQKAYSGLVGIDVVEQYLSRL
jgi:branched-chain amino acid aminotransferase